MLKISSKTKFSALAFFMLLSISFYAAKPDAFEYITKIGTEFKEVSENTWDYTSSVAHGKKARTVENKRKLLISQINSSIFKISHMKDFDGNTAFRDSAVAYLNLNKTVINQDYAKILDMEDIAEQSYDAMEAYMLAKEKADEKLQHGGDVFDEQYRAFAEANDIKLVESNDKLSKKLEKSGKVYAYYNKLYLIFFKSYKQEMYLVDAQNKSDFNAMEQNKNALATVTAEGLEKVKDIKDFEGDMSVKLALTNMLKFYENETKKYGDITAFYLVKESTEKVKKAMEAKKQSDRTNDDINKYNASLKTYNDALAKYNKLNMDLNNNRNKLLDKWNDDSAKFTDKHVPKK